MITCPPGILTVGCRWSSVAIVPVRILLLFKRALSPVWRSASLLAPRAVGADGRGRQDKSRTVRHGWRGKNSLSINTYPRGALSDHDVRQQQIASIHWCCCTSRPSQRSTDTTAAIGSAAFALQGQKRARSVVSHRFAVLSVACRRQPIGPATNTCSASRVTLDWIFVDQRT